MAKQSKGEECLAEALAANPLPGWDLTREHKLDASRRWTFDFAFPSQKLAIEVDGQRHRTYKGQRSDSEKLNEAVRQGWRVLRFPQDQHRKAAEWVLLVRELLCCPPSNGSGSDE